MVVPEAMVRVPLLTELIVRLIVTKLKVTLGALTEELTPKDPTRFKVGLAGKVASEAIVKLPSTLKVGLEPVVVVEPEPAVKLLLVKVRVAALEAVIVPLLVKVELFRLSKVKVVPPAVMVPLLVRL